MILLKVPWETDYMYMIMKRRAFKVIKSIILMNQHHGLIEVKYLPEIKPTYDI